MYMGLINKGWYGMFVACGIWCLADVSSVIPSCSDEGLTLETPAKHHIPQATNIPYQPLLIKPIFSVLAHAEKHVFFKTSGFQCSTCITAGADPGLIKGLGGGGGGQSHELLCMLPQKVLKI